MKTTNKWIVVTTINPPTTAIKAIASMCRKGWSAVVVGDRKTPPDWEEKGIHYLSIEKQKQLFGDFADMIPYGHYCRKNIGYLFAIQQGADCILETDDDNIPFSAFGKKTDRQVRGRYVSYNGNLNVYQYFTDKLIWPRGLPLDEIHTKAKIKSGGLVSKECPIQQYLADDDPDVDAIYRLVFKGALKFNRQAAPVILSKGCWCPFNSQNTLFLKEMFPLLYLPCHVNFRMTDIWRSFVAQAALWVYGYNISFHPPTVKQKRNEHNLMHDFLDEVVGYKENKRITELLYSGVMERSNKKSTVAETAMFFWKTLAKAQIIPSKEIKIIERWFDLIA